MGAGTRGLARADEAHRREKEEFMSASRETWIDVENLTPRQRVQLFRLFAIVATQNNCERVYVADIPELTCLRIEDEFPIKLPNRGGNRPPRHLPGGER